MLGARLPLHLQLRTRWVVGAGFLSAGLAFVFQDQAWEAGDPVGVSPGGRGGHAASRRVRDRNSEHGSLVPVAGILGGGGAPVPHGCPGWEHGEQNDWEGIWALGPARPHRWPGLCAGKQRAPALQSLPGHVRPEAV